jgi:hypothetical protein
MNTSSDIVTMPLDLLPIGFCEMLYLVTSLIRWKRFGAVYIQKSPLFMSNGRLNLPTSEQGVLKPHLPVTKADDPLLNIDKTGSQSPAPRRPNPMKPQPQ